MLDRWNRRMYALICRNQQPILAAIDPKEDVQEYEWLVSHIGQANKPDYQDRYKGFWSMKRAHLGTRFDAAYFGALNTAQPMPSLRNLCQMLYQFPRLKGDQALQFSFATKLRHMLNRKLPIFDDRVACFYLFQKPSNDLPLLQRINGLTIFQNFLGGEYRRVLSKGFLAGPISAFRQTFQNSPAHTDVKIIDWLIYGFVRLSDKGQITW